MIYSKMQKFIEILRAKEEFWRREISEIFDEKNNLQWASVRIVKYDENHLLIKFKKFFKKTLRMNVLNYTDILREKQNIAYADAIKARDQVKLNLEGLQEIYKQRQNIDKEKERKKAELEELERQFSEQNGKGILWN